MWFLAIISLILFFVIFLSIEKYQSYNLKNYAERLTNVYQTELEKDLIDNKKLKLDSKTRLYLFDKDSYLLKSQHETLSKKELTFLSFPSFSNYINNADKKKEIFKSSNIMYLFTSLTVGDETKFIVFARELISFNKIMNKTKNAKP
jgi:hypothetical protein